MMSVISIAFGMWSLLKIPDDINKIKWHYLRKWIWNGTKKEKYLRNELLPSYF
jgi:hypothetical protein